jgi:hypothetical protein
VTREFAGVLAGFGLAGEIAEARPHGGGHIHDTYLLRLRDAGGPQVLLQRINTRVFRDPERLMENIARVTEHLAAREDAGCEGRLRALRLIPTREGAPFLRDRKGEVWRAFRFIEGARSIEIARSPHEAREAAHAFGRFQRLLADLPGPRLHETIPRFHDTPARLAALLDAATRDPLGRAARAAPELDFAHAHGDLAARITRPLAAGELPERVVHNDAKIDNVLFDTVSGKAICVIDLDTVMPGAAAWDFGDLVRTMTSSAAEDEPNPERVDVRGELFEAVARGYLEATRGWLIPAEHDSLSCAGALIAFETGLRFLTDWLEGDVYFKTSRPDQNLDRARAQLALVRRLEERAPELEAILRRAAA